MTNNELDLTKANYGTVKELEYALAVLPWGATEPHNLHLPYTTDSILAQALSVDAADAVKKRANIGCMVLPPITLGSQNPGQWSLPFCIHTRYETQKAILTDIVSSLYRQGLRKLIIVNGHGGNAFKNMVRDLAYDYPDFTLATAIWFCVDPATYFEAADDHAGELETSVMMHYHPELVNLEDAGAGTSKDFAIESLRNKTGWIPRDWSKASIDTGIGCPYLATSSKGAAYASACVHQLSLLFEEIATKAIY